MDEYDRLNVMRWGDVPSKWMDRIGLVDDCIKKFVTFVCVNWSLNMNGKQVNRTHHRSKKYILQWQFYLLHNNSQPFSTYILHSSPTVSVRAVVGVVVEYVRSLGAVGVTVQHFLYELVITALVRTQHFYQLHQLLQYHVLADSKPLVRVVARGLHENIYI